MFFSVDLIFFAACGADLKKIYFNRDYASEFQEKQYPVQLFSSKQPESARVTAAISQFLAEKNSRWSRHPSSERFTIPISVVGTTTQLS